MLEEHSGTRSCERVKTLDLDELFTLRNALWIALEGKPYTFTPPADEPPAADTQAVAEDTAELDSVA